MIYHKALLIPTSDCIEKNNMPITHNAVVYDTHGRVIIESLRQSEFAAIKQSQILILTLIQFVAIQLMKMLFTAAIFLVILVIFY